VGAALWEEVNVLQKGANYGWPIYEGPSSDPAFEAPLHTYPHAGGDFDDAAITGAAFYDPPASLFPAEYAGDYFFGDFGTGNVKRMDVASGAVDTFATGHVGITDLDVGPDGALYYLIRATSGANGQVLRVTPDGAAEARAWRWHPTQRIEPQDDGGVVVRFRASGMRELAWHLFTWGDQVHVLAPDRLKTVMAGELEAARRALDGA